MAEGSWQAREAARRAEVARVGSRLAAASDSRDELSEPLVAVHVLQSSETPPPKQPWTATLSPQGRVCGLVLCAVVFCLALWALVYTVKTPSPPLWAQDPRVQASRNVPHDQEWGPTADPKTNGLNAAGDGAPGVFCTAAPPAPPPPPSVPDNSSLQKQLAAIVGRGAERWNVTFSAAIATPSGPGSAMPYRVAAAAAGYNSHALGTKSNVYLLRQRFLLSCGGHLPDPQTYLSEQVLADPFRQRDQGLHRDRLPQAGGGRDPRPGQADQRLPRPVVQKTGDPAAGDAVNGDAFSICLLFVSLTLEGSRLQMGRAERRRHREGYHAPAAADARRDRRLRRRL